MRVLAAVLALVIAACGAPPAPVSEPRVSSTPEPSVPDVERIVLDACFAYPQAHMIGPCVHAPKALNDMAPHFIVEDQEAYDELIDLIEEHHIGFTGMDPSEQPDSCTFPAIDFTKRTLLAQKVHSGHICSLKCWGHEVRRIDEEQKYVFSATINGTGHCKGKPVSWWIMVLAPKLPEGYEVEFELHHVHEEKDG